MPLNNFVLFLLAVALLGVYILGSEIVERSPRWGRLGRNRLSYALALGVYATTWTLFGSVGFAASQGYDFLAIYFGVTLSCIAIPFLWSPLAALVDRYRLGSIADVFAFRYQSRTLGAATKISASSDVVPKKRRISLRARSALVVGSSLILRAMLPARRRSGGRARRSRSSWWRGYSRTSHCSFAPSPTVPPSWWAKSRARLSVPFTPSC